MAEDGYKGMKAKQREKRRGEEQKGKKMESKVARAQLV